MVTSADRKEPAEGQRARPVTGGEEAGPRAVEYGRESEVDGHEEDEEDDQRSLDGSSDGGDHDEEHALRGSFADSRTGSSTSTTQDGVAGVPAPQKTQAAFVHKLWSMLYTPSLAHLIAWTDNGKAFTVFHPTEFARSVLPQFFKHSNFASFIRQLNMYSFAKVNDALTGTSAQTNPDGSQVQAWEFQNPAFQRDRPDLLAKIRRKSAKATPVFPVAPGRRRVSTVRAASARPQREASVSDDAGDEEEPAPRIQPAAISAPPTPSVLYHEGSLPAAGIQKVVGGLTEFLPVGPPDARPTRPRSRGESTVDTPSNRSPASYVQPQPLFAPPPPNPYYPSTGQYQSPPARSLGYPPVPNQFYSSNRVPPLDDAVARQVLALESQIRSLGEALYHAQQDQVANRAASYQVLGMLLGIVADLDVAEKRKEEVDACSQALSKLHPDAWTHSSSFQQPHAYPTPSGAHPAAPSYSTYSSYPPSVQASPQTTSYQQLNRIPTAESYTRSSRPDSARSHHDAPHSHPPHIPAALYTRPAPIAQSAGAVRPMSPARPLSAASMGSHQPPAVLPGQQQPPPHASQAYPAPRGTWHSSVAPNPRPTSLPSLSSLLGGVPANGDRRLHDPTGRESEPPDDRVRKKLRQ
ncbi:uncharacterized protein JCM15063_000055 [Sporobolomyces koalae]|uniref:uncharacterized protein n=1 Tax=Sporobolomyces koalae TaxID=500713 RepID=UPI00316E0E9D